GDEIHRSGKRIGFVTSSAMVPLQSGTTPGTEVLSSPGDKKHSVALALVDSDTLPGDRIQVRIRDLFTDAVVVPFSRKPDARLFFSSVLWDHAFSEETETFSKSSTANPISH
ncbi:MAG: hypothetical protein K9J83_06310, partial [Desulfarculaceae bacterium]|nr:hypothetical protein [Desulfarculaceae bacterium]